MTFWTNLPYIMRSLKEGRVSYETSYLLLCALLLIGCLPTPEVEVIPNKGEQKEWQVEAAPYVPKETTPTGEVPIEIEQQGGPLYKMLGANPI